MMNTQFTYHKEKLTNWLLTITLFFSIFTFSGYAGNSELRLEQENVPELIISNKQTTYKRTISYKKAFKFIICKDLLKSPCKNWRNTLFTLNILTKVKFKSISRQFYAFKTADFFLQPKNIPQSSDEDIFLTSIG